MQTISPCPAPAQNLLQAVAQSPVRVCALFPQRISDIGQGTPLFPLPGKSSSISAAIAKPRLAGMIDGFDLCI